MDPLGEKLRALGERARAEVGSRPMPSAPVQRVRRRRLVLVGAMTLAGLVIGAGGAWFLTRPESRTTEVAEDDEWVTAGTVEEVEDRYVVYVEEHEVFVLTMAQSPNDLIALSARSRSGTEAHRGTRMLFCTLSNLFESPHGEVFDRAGASLDERSVTRMAVVAHRVRNGTVEIAPDKISENNLDRFGGPHGPPCGEWGDVVEGPPGFALATEAPPGESKASIAPSRLQPGQKAELTFAPGEKTSGLAWSLFRLEGEIWHWAGLFVGGPGYESYFDIAPLDKGGGIHDIGFGGEYSMDIEIPKLDPGTYRLTTHSIGGGSKPLDERTTWHYADFEVVPDGTSQ